jgi:hypothetical protein
MITLITGLPGSGKTLFTLKTVKDLAEKENRSVYYHGVPELSLDWQLMDKPEQWCDLPHGSIIVIDECQSTFRPRAASVTPPRHVAEFETHRHHGYDIFLITQHPMLLDGNVRRLTGRHYHVNRFYGFNKSTIHEFQQIRENVDKSTKGSIQNHFVYPKEVFSWYKSAELHTVKKRLPMRLFLMLILPCILIGLLWFAYTTIMGLDKVEGIEPAAENGTAAEQSNGNLPMMKPEFDVTTQGGYLKAYTPVIKDLPQSAPIYQEIVKPVRAPYAAACISMGSRCQCFSQQATKIDVSQSMCKAIVAGGQFMDFNANGEQENQEGGLLRGEQPLDGGSVTSQVSNL